LKDLVLEPRCRAGLLLWWFDFARAAANVAAALASPIAFLTDANCDADKGFFASDDMQRRKLFFGHGI
jgi:hypothetical protein